MAKKKEKSGTLSAIIAIFLIVVVAIVGVGVCKYFVDKKQTKKASDEIAQMLEKGRNLMIINNTGQTINDAYLYIGKGTKIAHQKNPDDKNIRFDIISGYKKINKFTVVLIDRYGIKYEKEDIHVKEKGITEVKISEEDYVKQNGDWWRKIERVLNGD